jgi:ketosteroid isomerase-like protein
MPHASDEAAVRGLLERRARSTTAKDAEGSVSARAQDIVAFDIAPPLAHRGEAATGPDAARKWLATWDGAIGYDFSALTIRTAGELAFCYGFLNIGTRTNGERTACGSARRSAWKSELVGGKSCTNTRRCR